MKFKGYDCELRNDLAYRPAKTGELDLWGEPIPINENGEHQFQVIINADTKILEEDAPIAFPISYVECWYGYGQSERINGSEKYQWVWNFDKEDYEIVNNFIKTPVFFMCHGRVWQSYNYRKIPDEIKLHEFKMAVRVTDDQKRVQVLPLEDHGNKVAHYDWHTLIDSNIENGDKFLTIVKQEFGLPKLKI